MASSEIFTEASVWLSALRSSIVPFDETRKRGALKLAPHLEIAAVALALAEAVALPMDTCRFTYIIKRRRRHSNLQQARVVRDPNASR